MAVCEHAANVAPEELDGAPGLTRVVVHVDASMLSGEEDRPPPAAGQRPTRKSITSPSWTG